MDHFEYPEGATPINDCSGLIPAWVQNINDLNRVEAENIMSAQRNFLHKNIDDPLHWFHIGNLKKIHRAMFSKVWSWAGKFRQSITSIGIHPTMISSHLAEFCHEVISWSENPVELTFLERAVRIHHRLVFIHPFENGNGRFSRLIADRYLLAYKCSHPSWPDDLNESSTSRKRYIQSLKDADLGNYNPLFILMKKLGAKDPKIEELQENLFYRPFLKGEYGKMLLKALLRCS